jgi:hypothetical protein
MTTNMNVGVEYLEKRAPSVGLGEQRSLHFANLHMPAKSELSDVLCVLFPYQHHIIVK